MPKQTSLYIAALLACICVCARAEIQFPKSQTVFEVQSALESGNGVLILLNGTPQIVTNSHILKGLNSAVIRNGAIGPIRASVKWDSPIEDLTVLDFQNQLTPSQLKSLIPLARDNFSVCTESAGGLCSPVNSPPNKEIKADLEYITYFQKGQIFTITNQTGLIPATQIRDQFVSGDYPYLWSIRAYTRNGISGGVYFRNDSFAGIVTKVSHDLQPTTLAIPAEGISAVLSKLAHGAPDKSIGIWQQSQSAKEKFLTFKDGDSTILQTAGLGGDVGNGGDPKNAIPESEPHYWHLQNSGFLGCPGNVCLGGPDADVVNPFFHADEISTLRVNNQQVMAIEIDPLFGSNLFQQASLARYRWLKTHLPFGASINLLGPDNPKLIQLDKIRQQLPPPFQYVRVWNKLAPDQLSNATPTAGTFGDGVINLFLTKRFQAGPDMYLANLNPQIFFSEKNAWFELGFPSTNFYMKISADLALIDAGYLSPQTTWHLVKKMNASPDKVVFASPDSAARAVFIYQGDDLAKLQSLFVELPDRMVEFDMVQPNMGVSH